MTQKPMDTHELIYDWNLVNPRVKPDFKVMISDETLRDGLQSPSITQPEIQDKVFLLYMMNNLGIDIADLGLCCAGEQFKYDVTVLAKEIADQKLNIAPQSAARTMVDDISPIVDASQAAGIAIEAAIFLGSSPIRQFAEGWDLDFLLKQTEEGVSFAIEHDLPVMFVTEDTTRAHPGTLEKLYATAIQAGAQRICISDTVGHASPEGVRALVKHISKVVDRENPEVGIDWHGHRDRGMDIPNTLAAIEAGADRVHGCGLGIGERSGNTPMEILLVNLNLLGWANRDLTSLPDYCSLIEEKMGAPIPFNYPIVGADSFRTSTGVHAAAVVKAIAKNDDWLCDCVYCGVPSSMVGRKQGIEIGPMSGEHNVRFYLKQRGIEDEPIFIEKILAAAKRSNKLLTEKDVMRMVRVMETRLKAGKEIEESDLEDVMTS